MALPAQFARRQLDTDTPGTEPTELAQVVLFGLFLYGVRRFRINAAKAR